MTVSTAQVAELGTRIWAWRDATAFHTGDDIPRSPRPDGWLPRFDPASVAARLAQVEAFRAELDTLDPAGAAREVVVDLALLRSAVERVWWDCAVVRSWQRDAVFLLGQVLGPYVDLLLPRPPFGADRQAALVAALTAVPAQVAQARANLADGGTSGLAGVAVRELDGIEHRLAASVAALGGHLDDDTAAALAAAADDAGVALAGWRTWLAAESSSWPGERSVGREAFVWYLRHVALVPDDPEALAAAARQEYHRAVVWEAVARAGQGPDPAPFATVGQQVARQAVDEQQVRDFLDGYDLLSQAGWGHYLIAPTPAYLAPLSGLAVNDDLTGPDRPGVDGVSYTPDPGPDLPYFYAANAIDPRLGIIHEGAHYQQLVRTWANPDPVRRHYYDSTVNEGLAHYHEELTLQAGLFADAPASRTRVANFMRLRALRVVVDVGLATGAMDLPAAVATFVDRVPMDEQTARAESAMYLGTPGLAMSYLVGKLQVLRLVADVALAAGGEPDLRALHDRLWAHGNVPLALQRYELLGDDSELAALTGDRTPRPSVAPVVGAAGDVTAEVAR